MRVISAYAAALRKIVSWLHEARATRRRSCRRSGTRMIAVLAAELRCRSVAVQRVALSSYSRTLGHILTSTPSLTRSLARPRMHSLHSMTLPAFGQRHCTAAPVPALTVPWCLCSDSLGLPQAAKKSLHRGVLCCNVATEHSIAEVARGCRRS